MKNIRRVANHGKPSNVPWEAAIKSKFFRMGLRDYFSGRWTEINQDDWKYGKKACSAGHLYEAGRLVAASMPCRADDATIIDLHVAYFAGAFPKGRVYHVR